jgi:A/G-specific adenine glycosylase
VRTSLLDWYAVASRTELPWRKVRDPYYTLVSEFMLQQTQVDRVVERFSAFVARFPDFGALARASTADVLRQWKGLGYNSRAVRLKAVGDAIVARYGGAMPSDSGELRALPGIGAYTAAAIRAFAFELDDAPIDTNVRRILQRVFFGIEPGAAPAARELEARARALVPPGKAHDWTSALMDLGATICTARAPKCLICPLRRECVAAPIDATRLERLRRQASAERAPRNREPFESTARYARGRIVDRLRELAPGAQISLLDLHGSLKPLLPGRTPDDVRELVAALEREGVVARRGEGFALPENGA